MLFTMIEREITPHLVSLFKQYPFVTVTGPRQSGKTTLCRAAFPNLDYVNLEAPDNREFAESDPRGFLAQFENGAILDEVQRVPMLFSYLQVIGDELGRNGLFVLTGSTQFEMIETITQSLAGRTGLLQLLPLSLAELKGADTGSNVNETIHRGFYPRVVDQGLDPGTAYGNYVATYVERDVRQISEIRNLTTFQRFVRLCAGRVGQLVNLASLGSDAGVSHTTAKQWLSVLEASYVVFQLQPYHANFRKRLIRSPKLYFYDVGLASYLIGIQNAGQIATHPMRGPLFENLVISEILKHRFNRNQRANLSFYRDSQGLECDVLYRTVHGLAAIEIKAGSTVASDFFGPINRVADLIDDVAWKAVVYGGERGQKRSYGQAVPLDALPALIDSFDREPTSG